MVLAGATGGIISFSQVWFQSSEARAALGQPLGLSARGRVAGRCPRGGLRLHRRQGSRRRGRGRGGRGSEGTLAIGAIGGEWNRMMLRKNASNWWFPLGSSVVQWHPLSFFFLVAAPLRMVFPKKGSLFLPGSLNN